MFLKDFPGIVMDELPQQPDSDMLHILSRPLPNNTLYDQKNKISILTTKVIRTFLERNETSIPQEFMVELKSNFIFQLNSREVLLHTIETGSICGNVWFLFEYRDDPSSKTLYTGQYTEHSTALKDKCLNDAIKKSQIANLYFDNTMASTTSETSIQTAAESIRQITINYPKHKICILSDRIGCENLYYSLATKYKFKIYPNACRRVLFEIKGVKNLFCYSKDEANILIPETLPPHKLETFTSAFNNQKYLNINVRLVATEREIKLIGNIKSGLVYIPFAPHPSAKMVMMLLQRVQPRKIYKIAQKPFHGSGSDLPDTLLSSYGFSVEDAQVDVLFEYSEVFDYMNPISLNDESLAIERSFLSKSSHIGSDHLNYNNDSQLRLADNINTVDQQNLIENVKASNVAKSKRSVPERNQNGNIMSVVQIVPAAIGHVNVSTSTENDVPEHVHGENGTKRARIISSISDSSGVNLPNTHTYTISSDSFNTAHMFEAM